MSRYNGRPTDRDPALETALRAAFGDPAAEAVDWDRLHDAVMDRAQAPLARLRSRHAWWHYAAQWARPAIPAMLAASVALVAAVGALTPEATAPRPLALEEALTTMPDDSIATLVLAGDADGLLRSAVEMEE